MTDPYRVLGVSPAAEDDVIRAAYLALMKRYHPDQNQSAEAAERAKEVAAAYALLSDRKRRMHWGGQSLMPRAAPAATWADPHPTRGRLGGLLLVLLSVALILFAWRQLPPPGATSPLPAPVEAEASGEPLLAPPETTDPEPLIDVAEASPVAELPEVVLSPIVARVAPEQPPGRPPRAQPARVESAPVRATPALPASPRPSPRIDLEALERHQSLLFNQSLRNADPSREARLIGSAKAFAGRLAGCTDLACKRDAYLDRNREIAEIMRR